MSITWVIVIIVALGGAVAAGVVGMRYYRSREMDETDPVMARLADATSRGEVVSLEQVELEQPFSERIILPIIRKIGELSARFTPQKALEEATRKLELAGNPGRIDAPTFLATRFIVAGVLVGLVILMASMASNTKKPWTATKTILLIAGAGGGGFFLPQLYIQGRINGRQKEVVKAMPDALDLLTICVEAGLGFDAAMSKVSEKWDNELSMAFSRTIREVQLGKTQREALRDMSDRLGVAELTSFVAAVIQSQTLGVSLAKVLRIQSDQMRVKRRQRAEELAHQAPVKMIIPMTFLTFPCIFIILMTPAVIRMQKIFS